jgi:hypothetical protein
VEEDLLDHSPAAHVRRPRVDHESRAIGLDRNEIGALLVAAGALAAACAATAASANLFHLRRAAVLRNVPVVARQPTAAGYQLAA